MRKILISVLCSFYLFFISCTHDSNAYIEVTKPESHQNQLINYAVTGNYKSDETHIEQSLLSFLDKTNESESRCNTSNYTLKKLDQLVYKTETSSDLNRSSNPCNYEDINFYLYKIDNDSDNNTNYAILSDDKRIGEIICIMDADSFYSDISDNPFMQLFCNNLEDYIKQTINTWNSIFPKYNSRASYSSIASSGNYEYSNWKYNKGCIGGILKTCWTQGYPYNTAIEKVKGKEYVTGCGAIAVSQIMTKFEYPEKCSKDILNEIKKKWSLASNWDGIYDWSEMKKNPRAYNLTDKGEMMVATLVFDVAEKMNSSYGKDETTTNPLSYRQYLDSLGYTCGNNNRYNLTQIKQSINKGYPVLISGNDGSSNSKKINFLWFSWNMDVPSGHTWIVDGYCNMTCTAQHKTDSSDIKRFTTDYVHCNVGWRNANYNGYYISEVFSFNNYANLTDDDFKREINRSSGTSHYYNKSLYILTHIRPKNYPEFLDEK